MYLNQFTCCVACVTDKRLRKYAEFSVNIQLGCIGCMLRSKLDARPDCVPALLPSSWPLPCRERGCVGQLDFMRTVMLRGVGIVPNVVAGKKNAMEDI